MGQSGEKKALLWCPVCLDQNHASDVWPWESHLTFLSLHFYICHTGIVTLTWRHYVRIQGDDAWKALSVLPDTCAACTQQMSTT